MSSLVVNRLAQMRGWSARLGRWKAVEVADSFCTAWQKVAVELDSCRGGIEQQEEEVQVEALGCEAAVVVASKPCCAAASTCRVANPCLDTCRNSSHCGSIPGDCDVCIRRNDVRAHRILGRRSWIYTGRFCIAWWHRCCAKMGLGGPNQGEQA